MSKAMFVLLAIVLLSIAIPIVSRFDSSIVPFATPRQVAVNTPITRIVRPTAVPVALLPNQVTLNASPISDVAQMFGSVGVNANVIKQFPDGTRCTRISGPDFVSIEGIGMSFYMLDCGNGSVGYVNAKWVND